jgi:hypothetical protein
MTQQYHANLDTPLTINGDRAGLFDTPTPREVLSNGGTFSVQYVSDNLADSLVQTSVDFANSINQGWNVPGTAGSSCNGNNNPVDGGDNNNGGDDDGGDGGTSETPPPTSNGNGGGGGNNGNPPQLCLNLLEQCDLDMDCCSAQCRGDRCWDPSANVNPNNGGDGQNCRPLEQACNQNWHCCSGQCAGGECWDPSLLEDDNVGGTDDGDDNAGGTDDGDDALQGQGCDLGQADALCSRNSECCSSLCLSGLCRGTSSRANERPVCASGGELCYRGADCCSGRCSNGECQVYSNLRRATSNEYWQLPRKSPVSESHEPRFSSPALDARWDELMSLYNGTRPDLVFEILGREDCDNRSQAEQHIIESASPEWIQTHHKQNGTDHEFDCHYVIAQ